ncbi:MAG TPA: SPOR domain-containing protein [Candidatus Hydrogenedentes bacterium]|nr:SPOR domain-containing protein [Candidatus Hydrogenedentota bacterium]
MSHLTTTKLPSNSGKRGEGPPSNRLIIGICIALFSALVCFMCGILLGRWQAMRQVQHVQVAPAEREVETSEPRHVAATGLDTRTQENSEGEGVQAYPRPVVLPAAPPGSRVPREAEEPSPPLKRPGPSELVSPQLPSRKPMATRGAPAVELEASTNDNEAMNEADEAQAPPSAPHRGSAVATETDHAATPEPGSAPMPEPQAPQLPPVSDQAELSSTRHDESEVVPAPVPAPVPDPKPDTRPSASAQVVQRGAYGIQVAAFFGENRQQAAEDYQRRLKTNSGMDAMLLSSEDGTCVRVILGGYSDIEAASAACAELRKRAGFRECFVKPLD